MNDDTSERMDQNKLPVNVVDMLSRLYTRTQIDELALDIPKSRLPAFKRKLKISFGHYQKSDILICNPKRCPFQNTCPLVEINKAPEGELCPIEEERFNQWVTEYARDIALRAELEIHEMDIVMQNLIRDMVSCDLIIARCNAQMANQGSITERRVTMVNPLTGSEVYEEEPSKLLDVKIKFMKKKEDIYKQLIATPEMVAKLQKKTGEEGASQLSKLTDDVKTVLAGIKTGLDNGKKIEDIEVEIKDKAIKLKPTTKAISYSALPPEPDYGEDD